MQARSEVWKALWASGTARLEARAIIGGVEYEGVAPVVTRALMQDGPSVGNVVSATCRFSLRTEAAIPRSAEVKLEMRLTDGAAESEWLPAGTFYISKRSKNPVTGVLTLECYDALLKANALWEPTEGDWPRSVATVMEELTALLGVEVDGRTSLEAESYTVGKPAIGTTVREVLGGIAAYNGGNWIMTPENKLRLVPFAPEAGADAVEVAAVIGGVDAGQTAVVTGIRCAAGEETALIGDNGGLVLDVTIAPLWAADLAERLIGAEYRHFSLRTACYDPAAELGDPVGYGGESVGVLCAETAALGPAFRGDLSAPDAAELADEYPYIGGDGKLLAVAKAYAREAVEALDDGLTQQEIFNRLTDNGAAQGMVLVDGQLYINASYINTGTLTLGGAGNVNGVMRVLDADGNVVGIVDNSGVDISEGSIVSYSKDRLSRALLQVGGIGFQVWGQDGGTGQMMWLDTLSMENGTTPSLSADHGMIIASRYGDITLRNRYAPSLSGCTLKLMQNGAVSLDVADDGDRMGVRITGTSFEITDAGGDALASLDGVGELNLSVPLPIGSGGTGLTASPSMLTNLGSTAASNVLQASPRPGVTGTLPAANGGTGQTSLQATRNAMGLGNTTGALPIENGGTGKTTAADAWTALGGGASGKHADSYFALAGHGHTFLNLAPGNKAAATGAAMSDDAGPFSVRWYSESGKVANQPSQYGFMLTCANGKGSVEEHALWLGQNNGNIYHRGTNGGSSASPPAWITVLDSANYTAYCPTKTGTGASGTWGISVTGNAANVTGTVAVGHGGTGATTAAGALSNLGIKYKTVTATTDTNGILSVGLSGTRYQIISATCLNANALAIPYYRRSDATWNVQIANGGTFAAAKSVSRQVQIVYIDFGANI